MSDFQSPLSISALPAVDAIDVAVIELLGAKEAEICAADLKLDAKTAAISVRVVSRSGITDNVPRRRRRGVDESTAGVVFLIEDTTRLAPGWAVALRNAFMDPSVAAVCGPTRISPTLSARYRALGRLEYGRFDGTYSSDHLPGNAFAVRLQALQSTFANGEGIFEYDLECRVLAQGWKIRNIAALTATYAQPDPHSARLSTRFGHGRLYGASRGGNRGVGVLKALLAAPVLGIRGLRAARSAGTPRQWISEAPWILTMALSWALGELTGQIAGKGNSERSWN